MGANKLTPYQSISHFARGLKVYDAKSMLRVGNLIDAMHSWNLHGSADKIEAWVDRMYDCVEAEYDAEPLGIVDWDEINVL